MHWYSHLIQPFLLCCCLSPPHWKGSDTYPHLEGQRGLPGRSHRGPPGLTTWPERCQGNEAGGRSMGGRERFAVRSFMGTETSSCMVVDSLTCNLSPLPSPCSPASRPTIGRPSPRGGTRRASRHAVLKYPLPAAWCESVGLQQRGFIREASSQEYKKYCFSTHERCLPPPIPFSVPLTALCLK